MMPYQSRHHPIADGLKQRCGRCGKGRLFKSYLNFHERCGTCDQSFSVADTADGPAFFVGFLALIVFTPMFTGLAVLSFPVAISALLFATLLTALIGSTLWLLPVFKAVLFNLQIYHRAEEGKFSFTGQHGVAPNNWQATRPKSKAESDVD